MIHPLTPQTISFRTHWKDTGGKCGVLVSDALYERSHVLLSFSFGCTKCIGFNHYYFKKKGKKREISVYCFREQHFVCFDKVNPVIFPFTCFSLENKGISETCSYMDRKILLKVGLEVKLVSLELSYIEVHSELNFKEQILY